MLLVARVLLRNKFAWLIALWCISTIGYAKTPQVQPYKGMVVSIHPLYLIANAITQGVEQPQRLLDPSVDGHSAQLTPKQSLALKNANYILWMGDTFEHSMDAAIRKSGNAANGVAVRKYIANPYISRTLLARPQTVKLPNGTLGSTTNAHVWFDPNQALAIARLIAHSRSNQYPHYRPVYMANLAQFTQRLRQAVQQIQAQRTALLSTAPIPYVSYVDVYQSLESTLGLTLLGSYTYEDVAISPQHLRWLNQVFTSMPVSCIAVSPAVAANLTTPPNIAKAIVNENLSQHRDFVIGWSSVARQFVNCAADTQATSKSDKSATP